MRGLHARGSPVGGSEISPSPSAGTTAMALPFLASALGIAVPDATIRTISITALNGAPQHLPLDLCRWPVWISTRPGEVTQVPGAGEVDEEEGWVDPVGFEQLWLPEDLPTPSCHVALAAVIKNGVPRYLLPCLECSVMTVSGSQGAIWHNRGLNSFPIGATWMPWGLAPFESLRLSAFESDMPPEPEPELSTDDEAEAAPPPPPAPSPPWTPLQPVATVDAALKSIMAVIADAPDEMANGYQFVVARLDSGPALPSSAVRPGKRVRLMLATALDDIGFDPNAKEMSWEVDGGYGLFDSSVFAVPAGGGSDFLPDVYRPLYPGAAASSSKGEL